MASVILFLWFSPYPLDPDADGFVLLVEDWMKLSRQFDGFRQAWEMRRTKRWQTRQLGNPR